MNRKEYLETQDSTLKDAGGVGLWAKADALTYFDDLNLVLNGSGK